MDGPSHFQEACLEGKVWTARLQCQNWHSMSTDETGQPKPLFWIGSTLRDLKKFPGQVRQMVGFALFQAQLGRKHADAKVLKGFGGRAFWRSSRTTTATRSGQFTLSSSGAVYALQAFQKKAKRGIKTPPSELEIVRQRLRTAEEDHAKRTAEEDGKRSRDQH